MRSTYFTIGACITDPSIRDSTTAVKTTMFLIFAQNVIKVEHDTATLYVGTAFSMTAVCRLKFYDERFCFHDQGITWSSQLWTSRHTLCLSHFYISMKPLLPTCNCTILFTNTFSSTLFFKLKLLTPMCFEHLKFHGYSENVNWKNTKSNHHGLGIIVSYRNQCYIWNLECQLLQIRYVEISKIDINFSTGRNIIICTPYLVTLRVTVQQTL